jgi:hypothetical protein
LQEPFVPHGLVLATSVHWLSGSAPAATGVQVPTVFVRAHDMQVPVQALLQQTPCAQWPVPQSESAAQVVPGAFLAQLPPMQKFPVEQSASTPQVVLHTPVVSQM